MNEQEWLTSEDPAAMLALRGRGGPSLTERNRFTWSDRKLRLFACACCRQVWHLLADDVPCWRPATPLVGCPDCHGTGRINRSRRAVEVAERYADGLGTEEEREIVFNAASSLPLPQAVAANCLVSQQHWPNPLRRILEEFGTPPTQAHLLREIVGNPWIVEPDPSLVGLWRVRNHGRVYDMIRVIYDERRFEDLPILADALEDAGCDNADILTHLRGPGPHVLGCWVLDLLLGKE